MAIDYKNANLDMTTTLTDVYECPTATKAIVMQSIVANVDGSASASATVLWTDDSDTDKVTNIIKAIPVAANESLVGFANNLILEAGDRIRAQASEDSDLELTIGVAEITS